MAPRTTKKYRSKPRRRVYRKKRVYKPRRMMAKKLPTVNTASIRENYTLDTTVGTMNIFNSVELADITYNRAQAVAQAYQQFRIRYVKLTFRPSADTFTPLVGNTIPQLYFQMDKSNAFESDVNLQTLLDVGTRPIRFDDKNIVKIYKPTVLTYEMNSSVAPGTARASGIKQRPWLSTNDNAGAASAAWAPSTVDHLGCVWHVTNINPATPPMNYKVDVEVVFDFRKPNWSSTPSPLEPIVQIKNGQAVPVSQATPL